MEVLSCFPFSLPEHDKLCLIYRSSTPTLNSFCCSVFQTLAPSCCFGMTQFTCSLPRLLHAKTQLAKALGASYPLQPQTKYHGGSASSPPTEISSYLGALPSHFSFLLQVLSLPQLGYGLTLVWNPRGLKLCLCPSCQQFTSHRVFVLA